ncbi:saccharopine dehydrogenase [Coprinopsis marcescibilis]|uniref:Saccharopine dehydrogenase n=1 Tax=Coprinopsis marcescibilis TaxID=230819 RepID=A0A5C3L0R6_COPMA|nr:saccharopine dehydrogenase [Coprinopsis marcescibilis]
MATRTDILLLGATGFAGRLIAHYLATHPQRSYFSLGLAARSLPKLRAIVQELGAAGQDIRQVELDVTDPASLDRAIKSTRVVINTVGPFWTWGTPVVRACVKNNVHYVDITGEVSWIKQILTEFDFVATKTRTVIVPACGYDSIPSDISAHLAHKALLEYVTTNYPGAQFEGLNTSISAHKLGNAIVSGGTIASFLTALEEVPYELAKESQNPFVLSPFKRTPLPFPQLVYNLPVPNSQTIKGSMFVMRNSNAAIVHRTAGLLDLHAREVRHSALGRPDPKLENARYGSTFVYDEFLVNSSTISSIVTSVTLIVGFLILKVFTPIRTLAKSFLPGPGTGPSNEEMDKGYLHLTNISTAAPSPSYPPLKVKSEIKVNGDPGYRLTAAMISESALSLLLPPPSASPEVKKTYNPFSALPPMAKQGGILTPMTAFGDVLIQRLRDSGHFEFNAVVFDESNNVDRKQI